MSKNLYDERRDYEALSLTRSQLDQNPFIQFESWLEQAQQAEIVDATAMTLATTDSEGQPQARIVLLKSVEPEGFTFFTNQQSHKGLELAANPKACLLFYWKALERQVRINGSVTLVSRKESLEYFNSRPLDSRFSAAASAQSQPVENRQVLESRVETLHESYPDGDIPCPEHWGGYRLKASAFEFWQGRPNRLHDRFRYSLQSDGSWLIQRLNP